MYFKKYIAIDFNFFPSCKSVSIIEKSNNILKQAFEKFLSLTEIEKTLYIEPYLKFSNN